MTRERAIFESEVPGLAEDFLILFFDCFPGPVSSSSFFFSIPSPSTAANVITTDTISVTPLADLQCRHLAAIEDPLAVVMANMIWPSRSAGSTGASGASDMGRVAVGQGTYGVCVVVAGEICCWRP